MLKDTEWGQDLKEQIKLFCKETKISAKDFYTNLRLAVLGKKSSPAILDVIKALGKDATVEKLNFLLKDAK